jgi:hypothetical protein
MGEKGLVILRREETKNLANKCMGVHETLHCVQDDK